MLPEWFHQLGLMGWPLAGCSVVALSLCLERTVFFAKSRWLKEQEYRRLADHLTAHRGQPQSVRDSLASVMLSELQPAYFRGIKSLRVIGIISPMLGLLGTILGIISAFQSISVQIGPVAPSVIADGLLEAMLTTAVGLFIALPALLTAHLFAHLSEQQLGEFGLRLNRLSLSFEIKELVGEQEPHELAAEKLAA